MNQWNKEILRLAVPSIVTNVTVPLLGLVDLAIVGHIGNETMIGAIAVGSMIFNVMYWLMGFLRMGTSGMAAQEYGAQQNGAAVPIPFWSGVGGRALRLALMIAAGMLLLQVPLRWLSLWLMGPSAEVAALVRAYFNICIWGAPATLSLYVMTGWFIGMQDTRTPMVVSITQNIINIVASLVLVFGFKMQIEGVALGTLIAQWSGAVMAWGNLPRPLQRRGGPRGLQFFIKQTFNRKALPSFGGAGGWVFLLLLPCQFRFVPADDLPGGGELVLYVCGCTARRHAVVGEHSADDILHTLLLRDGRICQCRRGPVWKI